MHFASVRTIAAALFATAAFAGAAVTCVAGDDPHPAWHAARIGLPAHLTGEYAVFGSLDEPRIGKIMETVDGSHQAPVAILLHGCSGFGLEEQNLLYMLALNGFAVVVPDSFAVDGRESLCDPDTNTARIDRKRYEDRRGEYLYALERVREWPWADERRLFLIGFSEGGALVAQHPDAGFAGLVIIGWHCHGPGILSGLRAPPSVPVLAIMVADDPWYRNERGRHCGMVFGDRPGSRSVVIEGEGHTVLTDRNLRVARSANDEILSFLESVSSNSGG